MSFNPFTIIKSLLIKEENTLSPKQIEIVPGGTASTKTTLVGSQTTDKTLTLPDATDTLVGKATTDVFTNKSIDADTNTITNIENADIKVGAAIDAAKIHDGSVSNTEFVYLDGVTSNIQTQLTTNANAISDHIADATDAHAASAITNTPSGNLVATDVQSALNEIQTELDTTSGLAANAANKTLSNLTSPTAINQDLLPDADGTRDLGSASLEFAEAHINQILSATDLVLNPTNDIDANNKIIKNVAAPTANSHAVNKEYADSISAGLDPKEAVRVASTVDVGGSYATSPSNGQITGAATSIDSVSLTIGDRVLLKDQSDAKENGIYVYTASGEFTRSPDMDGSPSSEVSSGNYTFTTQGTLNSATGYVLTGNGILTLNVDNLDFTQFSGGSSGASRFLDNLLSPTAVNQNLIFNTGGQATLQTTNDATSQAINLVSGTGTTQSGAVNVISGAGAAANAGSGAVSVKSGDVNGTTPSGLLTLKSGDNSNGQTGQTQISTGAGTGLTGDMTVSTGASSAGSTGLLTVKSGNAGGGSSGNLVLDTGTATGTQGKVQLNGRYTEVTKPLNIVEGSAAVAVASQQSITAGSGSAEGEIRVTSSDSSQRVILTASSTGLSQAPNLISYGDAEGKLTSSTSIFVPYADAAGVAPVDGSGGSPNVTSAITATSPLSGSKSYTLVKDAANRQGQGWSIDFSVPPAHRARVQSIKFDYRELSGIFTAGTPTTDSDVTVWIYDVTNATVIQPSSYKLLSDSDTIADQFQAEFQTSTNGTTYRLIFHCSTTTTNAFSLMVDNIVVSPSQYIFGTPISDWQTYTPTLTGFGTPTSVSAYVRRVGDEKEYRGKFTIGTPTGVEARISLDSGSVSADSNSYPTVMACGTYARSVAAAEGDIVLIEPSVGYLTLGRQSGGTASLTKVNGSDLSGTISYFAKVKIAGQSSSVQMADQTSTRLVDFQAFKNGGAATANTTVPTWTTIQKDSHSAFNATTGVYTVPVAGDYLVGASIGTTSSIGIHNIYLNGTAIIRSGSSGQASSFGLIPNCKVGDQITLALENSLTFISANTNTFTISRISGPSQIASSETVAAKYVITTGASTTANTPYNYETKEFDTHNSVTTGVGTWKFTSPISGIYNVSVKSYAGDSILRLYKNGTLYELLTTVTNADGVHSGSTLIALNAGEYIDARPNATVTPVGQGGSTVAQANTISIHRIGNRG